MDEINKIDFIKIDFNKNGKININMKPTYEVSTLYNYCSIEYVNKKYIVDANQFNQIINFTKNFRFYNEDEEYPSYGINNKKICYLEFIYGLNPENYIFVFKNENKYDLRYKNVSIVNKDFHKLVEIYNIKEFINDGLLVTQGRYSGEYKNPICKIVNSDGEIELLMLCNRNILCKLCEKSYQIILNYEKNEKNENNNKKIIWSYHSNGYILGNNNLYIHQVITDYFWNGKGTKIMSVDHIDQDPLNNTYDNLRISSREEQEQNSKGIKEGTKRERKHNAKELPDGITQEMLPKYVVYYKECYNKEKDLYREFFKIERHPKLGKSWNSSKSNKITIKEKLQQAVKIINDLDNNIQPQEKKTLPLYITITNTANKSYLVYDKRDENGKRKNFKMILPDNYDIETELYNFNQKILEKYPED